MMVKVKGIPRKKDEITNDLITTMATKMGIKITADDIDISHRTSSEEDAEIIVKFDSRKARDKFYSARKSLKEKKITSKELGFEEGKSININESLTQINGELYKYTRNKLLKTK